MPTTRSVLTTVLGAAALGLAPAAAQSTGRGDTLRVTVTKNVAYAPPAPAASQGHVMDVFVPATATPDAPAPVVVWVAGSGWLLENGRDRADLVAAHLNAAGIAVAGVAIRSSGHATFPAQLSDIKAAIRFLRANAATYRLDPARIGIMGESSGGWTAAMAAVTSGVDGVEGDVGVRGPSSAVQAAVAFYPPTDFLQMDAHMIGGGAPFNAIFGLTSGHADPASPESRLLGCAITACPERVAQANPVTYVRADTPPLLILHGQQDLLVPYEQGALLADALGRAGARGALYTLPRGLHGDWNEYLISPDAQRGVTRRDFGAAQATPAPDLSWQTIIDFFRAMT